MSAMACLWFAWESHFACTDLPSDVPRVILGNVALVGGFHGAPVPAAQPKANRSRGPAKVEPGPQTSLPAGRGRSKGRKNISRLLRKTCQVHLQLTRQCRHRLQLLLHFLCRAATTAVRAAVLHHRALARSVLMKRAVLSFSMCVALVTFLPTSADPLDSDERCVDAHCRRQNHVPATPWCHVYIELWLPPREGYRASALFLRPLCRAVLSLCWCRGSVPM